MPERERDSQVSGQYRDLAREEPPRSVDDAILNAARREAEDMRAAPLVAPTGRRHWYIPLAAAAVILLSVAVTLEMQRTETDAEAVVGERPAAAAPSQIEPAQRDAAPAGAAALSRPTSSKHVEPRAQGAPHPSVAKESRSSAAPSAPAEVSPGSATRGSGLEVEAERRAAPAAQAGAAPPAHAADLSVHPDAETAAKPSRDTLSPEAWLERIARWRREGRHAEADAAYAAFRRRYPDYKIPEALRDQVLPR